MSSLKVDIFQGSQTQLPWLLCVYKKCRSHSNDFKKASWHFKNNNGISFYLETPPPGGPYFARPVGFWPRPGAGSAALTLLLDHTSNFSLALVISKSWFTYFTRPSTRKNKNKIKITRGPPWFPPCSSTPCLFDHGRPFFCYFLIGCDFTIFFALYWNVYVFRKARPVVNWVEFYIECKLILRLRGASEKYTVWNKCACRAKMPWRERRKVGESNSPSPLMRTFFYWGKPMQVWFLSKCQGAFFGTEKA